MIAYEKRFWVLAAMLAALAGFVDAIGFISLGGFFVSFMSGNSTRVAVGLVRDIPAAFIAGSLVLSFVFGVIAGTCVASRATRHRKPAVLALVTVLLTAAASLSEVTSHLPVAMLLAAAMGAENAVFQRNGEVSIGVTYMTGALVKLGQHIAAALMGGPKWNWTPHLILWASLVCGACLGASTFIRAGNVAIWMAVVAAASMTAYAAMAGPSKRAP
ncbi:YoaK family protein [Novosphingobium sp. 11B]